MYTNVRVLKMDSLEIEEKNKKRPLSKDEIEIFKTFIEFTRGSMSTLIALTATGGLLIRLGSTGGDKPPIFLMLLMLLALIATIFHALACHKMNSRSLYCIFTKSNLEIIEKDIKDIRNKSYKYFFISYMISLFLWAHFILITLWLW